MHPSPLTMVVPAATKYSGGHLLFEDCVNSGEKIETIFIIQITGTTPSLKRSINSAKVILVPSLEHNVQ